LKIFRALTILSGFLLSTTAHTDTGALLHVITATLGQAPRKPAPAKGIDVNHRQVEIQLMKDDQGKVTGVFAKICKGDPVVCVAYADDWNSLGMKVNGVKLTPDSLESLKNTLSKGPFAFDFDITTQNKDELAMKQLLRELVTYGGRIIPGSLKRSERSEQEVQSLKEGIYDRQNTGTIHRDLNDLLREAFSERNNYNLKGIKRLSDENVIAYQIMSAIRNIENSFKNVLGEEMTWKTKDHSLADIQKLRESIREPVSFLRNLEETYGPKNGAEPSEEWGQLKGFIDRLRGVPADYQDLEWTVERTLRAGVAVDPKSAAELPKKVAIDKVDFHKLELPKVAPEPPVKFDVHFRTHDETFQLSKEKAPEAVGRLTDRAHLAPGILGLLSSLKKPSEDPVNLGEWQRESHGLTTERKEETFMREVYPGLPENPSFASIDRFLRKEGVYDSLQYKIVADISYGETNKNNLKLTVTPKKGRKTLQAIELDVEVTPKEGSDEIDMNLPTEKLVRGLLVSGNPESYQKVRGKAINDHDAAAAKLAQEARKKKQVKVEQDLNEILKALE